MKLCGNDAQTKFRTLSKQSKRALPNTIASRRQIELRQFHIDSLQQNVPLGSDPSLSKKKCISHCRFFSFYLTAKNILQNLPITALTDVDENPQSARSNFHNRYTRFDTPHFNLQERVLFYCESPRRRSQT